MNFFLKKLNQISQIVSLQIYDSGLNKPRLWQFQNIPHNTKMFLMRYLIGSSHFYVLHEWKVFGTVQFVELTVCSVNAEYIHIISEIFKLSLVHWTPNNNEHVFLYYFLTFQFKVIEILKYLQSEILEKGSQNNQGLIFLLEQYLYGKIQVFMDKKMKKKILFLT